MVNRSYLAYHVENPVQCKVWDTMAQSRQADKSKLVKPSDQRGRNAATTVNGSRPGDKYQRILDAAIAVIGEKGFHNSRVSDIADRADVADGTIYLYFKSKEQILMAALDYAFSTFLESARAELENISDPRRQLERLAELHLEGLGSNRGLAMVFQTELRQSAKFLSEFSHKHLIAYFDLIRAIVRTGQQSGVFRRELSDKIVANCFFGALDAIVTSWLLSEREYKLSGIAKPLVDVVLNGVEART